MFKCVYILWKFYVVLSYVLIIVIYLLIIVSNYIVFYGCEGCWYFFFCENFIMWEKSLKGKINIECDGYLG